MSKKSAAVFALVFSVALNLFCLWRNYSHGNYKMAITNAICAGLSLGQLHLVVMADVIED